MPVWTRGTIWNCRDPEDCRPLVDAHDTHSDSLRPAAFAEWAEFVGWRDADIVHQLNGGGLRAYHDSLSLDTVLTFHHGSLLENFPAVDKVTTADPRLAWGRPAPPAACQRPKHRVKRRWTVYDAHTGTRVRAP